MFSFVKPSNKHFEKGALGGVLINGSICLSTLEKLFNQISSSFEHRCVFCTMKGDDQGFEQCLTNAIKQILSVPLETLEKGQLSAELAVMSFSLSSFRGIDLERFMILINWLEPALSGIEYTWFEQKTADKKLFPPLINALCFREYSGRSFCFLMARATEGDNPMAQLPTIGSALGFS